MVFGYDMRYHCSTPHPIGCPCLDAAEGGAVPATYGLVRGDGNHTATLFVHQAVSNVGRVSVCSGQDVHRVGIPEHDSASHTRRSDKAVPFTIGNGCFNTVDKAIDI